MGVTGKYSNGFFNRFRQLTRKHELATDCVGGLFGLNMDEAVSNYSTYFLNTVVLLSQIPPCYRFSHTLAVAEGDGL